MTYTMKWRWHILQRTTIRPRINNQFRSTRCIHLEIVLNVGNLMKFMRNSILLWTIAKWFGGLFQEMSQTNGEKL